MDDMTRVHYIINQQCKLVLDIVFPKNVDIVVNSEGNVFAWGRDNYSQSTLPELLSDVIDVSGGYYHSLALKASGTVVGWGRNNSGQTDVPLNLNEVVEVDDANTNFIIR